MLESPLDCKDFKPVNPKGNQSWIFIGRTDAEAETPILWLPDVKSWLTRKDPGAGKDWRQEKGEMTEDEMIGWHHQLNGHEFEQAPEVGDGQGKPGVLQSMGSQRVRHDWATDLNWRSHFRHFSLISSMKFSYCRNIRVILIAICEYLCFIYKKAKSYFAPPQINFCSIGGCIGFMENSC